MCTQMMAIAIANKHIMLNFFKTALLSAVVIMVAFLSSCSQQLDDKDAVFSYVNDNLEGLNSFCDSVENTAPYFSGITHTNTHQIPEDDAAEIVEGMYAIGRINNSLFYEEVDYAFVEEPLEKGVFDTINMYTDYTLSYSFLCYSDDESSVGFYYTETDKPLYCGKEYDFKASGDGYEYTLPNNDVYYTEKICENYFFYQTSKNSD